MKLLWHSNAPWAPTGYGQQCGLFARELAKHYDLMISSFYGLEGSPIPWNGIRVLPGIGGEYGNESLIQHAERFFGGDLRGGMVTTLLDVWVLNPEMAARMDMACWVPVDHEPAPPKVVEFFQQSGAVPIAMSRFGEQQLEQAGLEPLYVPHGVDIDLYRPHDKAQARGSAFPEDAFVVGMVAANKGRPSRKGFAQAFQAFRKLLDSHDNAYLYLHTLLDPAMAGGENLAGLLNALDIPIDRVRVADQYAMLFQPYSHEDMAKLYSALDVLLNPALGEGFGVPILEAAACGTPAIVTDFSAMREVCGAGWHVDHSPYWSGLNSWQALPDVDDIAEALKHCYCMSKAAREKLSQQARDHALQYAVPRVMREHMLPALEAARERFEDRKPVALAPLKAAA